MRSADYSLLLDLSTSLATVRDRMGLLRKLFDRAQPVFGFHDVGLFVLSADDQLIADWAAIDPTLSPSFGNEEYHQLPQQQFTYPGSGLAELVARFARAGAPVVVPYDAAYFSSVLDDTGLRVEAERIIRAGGYREFMGTLLRSGGQVLGYLCFNALESGHFQAAQFELFQAVADQVASAVANILANEEMLRREQEKSLLLNVAQTIATVNDKQTLLATIFKLLRPVVEFEDLGLGVLDPDGQHLVDWPTEWPRVYDSPVNDRMHEQGQARLPYPGTLMEHTLHQIEAEGQPLIVPLTDELVHQWPDAVYLPIEIEQGFRETIITTLKTGGRLLGSLNLNSKRAGYFATIDLKLFQALADQIAVAVANILAHEEIAEREHEKTVLLAISESLATIRDKQQLLKTVFEKVRPLLLFYDTGLFVLDAEQQYIDDWSVTLPAVSPSEANLRLLADNAGRILYVNSAMQYAVGQLRAVAGPQVFAYTAEMMAQFPDYPQFAVMREVGYKESVGALLRTDQGELGILFFNSLTAGHFQSEQFNLVQTIADQVAVAVANILANEEIMRREAEKAMLLGVSQAIATVRDKQDLLRLLVDKIRPVLGFYDCGLFVLDPDGQHHTDWSVLVPEMDPSDGNVALHAAGLGRHPHPGSVIEANMQRAAKGAFILDFQQEFERHPTYPFFSFVLDFGYREALVALLRVGGQPLGVFYANAKQAAFFRASQLPLFQALADQVAVAVANILANEEILSREREKDQLLGISTAVVTVRNRADLLGILDTPLKELFGFATAAVVTSVGPDYHQHLVVLPTAAVAGATAPPALPEGLLPNAGSPYDWMLGQPAARRISLTELLAVAPDYPDLCAMQAAGITESFGAVLRHGGRPIGFLWFHYHEAARPAERQLPLFQAVADQFSVALANILANEEILAREQEKTLQLAVTTALTNADEWAAKFFTVAEEIGRVVPWDVCRFLFPGRAGLDLSWRRAGTGTVERLYPEMVARELGVGPLELRELVRETAPLYQKAALYGGKKMARLVRQYGLLKLTHEKWGVQSKLFLPVRQHGELVAVFILASRQPHYYQPDQLALLERLAPQLALGLENLFSFEKIEQQERELTQQLALNNALVTIKDSFNLYKTVAEELTPLVKLDSLSAWTFTADQLLHFTVLRRDETGAFADITEASRAAYPEMEALETESLLKRELRPAVYSGDAFAAMCDAHQVYRVRRDTFNVASSLELPLPVRNGLRAVLVFSSRAAFAFTDDDLRQVLPFAPQIALAVENLVAHEELNQLRKRAELEKVYLSEEIKTTHNFEEMVGVSPVLHEVFRQISQVAGTDATVLITGETGTGKELIARTLHSQSPRRDRTLIKLNCAALPASLIESELFGHEKGAFTGAIDKRVGKFELAQGSTIFLDEIGEMPLELQSKLLRVLQEREFERVGGNKVYKANVRVVAATNRNLAEEVAAGRFRADLYYRLNVFPIHMPALRQRPEDIPLLAQHFARKFTRSMGKPYCGIKETALAELLVYNWPGNIRELENLVEQAVIVCPGPLEWARPLRPVVVLATLDAPGQPTGLPAGSSLRAELDYLEKDRILAALKQSKGRIRGKKGAALVLGLKATTLESKMEKLGIRKEQVIVAGPPLLPATEKH